MSGAVTGMDEEENNLRSATKVPEKKVCVGHPFFQTFQSVYRCVGDFFPFFSETKGTACTAFHVFVIIQRRCG